MTTILIVANNYNADGFINDCAQDNNEDDSWWLQHSCLKNMVADDYSEYGY